jgi:hypothetical protein
LDALVADDFTTPDWIVRMVAPLTAEPSLTRVTVPASVPAVTVNAIALLATPFTFTTILPLTALTGTVIPMLVALQLVGETGIPPSVTVLNCWDGPKFDPAMVTAEPEEAEFGETEITLGAGATVNRTLLLGPPFANTIKFPVVAPAGTETVMLVGLHSVGVEVFPVNVVVPPTELSEAPKLVPFIVTVPPIAAIPGMTL